MTEKFKPLSAEFLAERGECCSRGCVNCPYIPRHGGGKEVDGDFFQYAMQNPEITYDDYVTFQKEGDSSKLV